MRKLFPMETRGSLTMLKPSTTRRGLLFIAGGVWAVAGTILAFRGVGFIEEMNIHPLLLFALAIAGGLIFFKAMFVKISSRHIGRIVNLPVERPCAFSFLNWKGYLMMGLMITMGIWLRRASFIPHEDLGTAYVMMAVPLLASSARFICAGYVNKRGGNDRTTQHAGVGVT